MSSKRSAVVLAGIPAENLTLYHRVRFAVGDPAAWLELQDQGTNQKVLIVRDIELARARETVPADRFACPADFAPSEGLSGDRATATAQAVAECLRREQIERVTTDRTLPFIYAWHMQQAGIAVDYSPDLGVIERRVKTAEELSLLAEAQQVTEQAMEMACGLIARAEVGAEGQLMHEGSLLTSERIQRLISEYLLERGYATPHGSIVASLPASADCHDRGSGPLKTGEAVIVDIFPISLTTHYCGDCTRTVVHGTPSDEILRMHAAVVQAKAAATAAARAGVKADDVHAATKTALAAAGYRFARGEIADDPVMPHGTGHGIGLEIHEPILLDDNGGTLLAGEVFTIEPGLYSRKFGGVRVEDMVVVTDGEPQNFNKLHEGLDWK